MGYYIEVPENHNKTQQLIDMYGAERCTGDAFGPPEGKTLLCVMVNPLFDAIGICYDEREYQAFSYPDGRLKRWLLLDTEKVIELCPSVAAELISV